MTDTPQQPATPETPVSTEAELVAPELAAVTRERDEWKDKAYRLAAEMENIKRRTEGELENARKFALQSFAKDLLPIADNLSRALGAPAGNEAALREGVTLVAAALEQTFNRHGITAVEAKAGQPLNPDHHQAMSQVASEHPHGHVAEELQQGYTLQGRLLRPALVSVSNGEKPQ